MNLFGVICNISGSKEMTIGFDKEKSGFINSCKSTVLELKERRIELFYNDEDIFLINNEKFFFASENNLVIEENGRFIKPEIDKLNNLIETQKENIFNVIVSNINGVLIDKAENKIYISSTRAAAGRFFYYKNEDDFVFSNNFVWLLKSKKESVLNHKGLFTYLKYGAAIEDESFDVDIKTIPVSHYLVLSPDNTTTYKNYFKFSHTNRNYVDSDLKLLDEVEDNIKKAMEVYANGKIHILISGGIDSSLTAFYLNKINKNMIGHFCMFGTDDPELKYAQDVSKILGIELEVHTIFDNMVIDEIKNTAKNTSYPHADFSNISVNFLVRQIKEKYGSNSIIIECNGADDGFGYGGLNQIQYWNKLYRIPRSILSLLSYFIIKSDIWMYDSKSIRKIMALYRAKDKNLFSSHIISSGGEMVYRAQSGLNSKTLEILNINLNSLIEGKDPSPYELMNTAQFFHINSRLWVAKAYTPSQNLGIRTVFPYTWKNFLELQARIPLDMKVHDGIVKWPLKHLLEKFMDKEFIYRAKSGFTPPLIGWIENDENYNYFSGVILKGEIVNYLDKDKIIKILKLLKNKKSVSRFAINLIWSILFFEEWLIQNRIRIKR